MPNRISIVHRGSSSLAGRTQEFVLDRITLGRRPDNQVVFDPAVDRAVSGHHAELTVIDGVLRLSDLGSQNGTWVDDQRITAPVALAPGQVVRLGQAGPEFTASLAGAMPAAASAGPAKTGIGAETLEKAITRASLHERKRSRSALTSMAIALVVVLGGGVAAWAWIQHAESTAMAATQARLAGDAERLSREVAAAARTASEARQVVERDLKGVMGRYDEELRALRGQISEGEGSVARLIVEIQQRDEAMERIARRQDLTEAERARMLAETEAKMATLKTELKASEAKLREEAKSAGGPDWAGIAERYRESLFLVVYASKPDAQGRQSVGIGTAFAIRADGLLGTNAHVAKPLLDGQADGSLGAAFVIQNHSGRVFDIRRMAIHPQYGPVNSPDVAVIQIANAGATFTAMPLADEARLRRLRIGTQLGTMGYPGELLQTYLAALDLRKRESKTALATFKDGWIGRITDFEDRAADYAAAHWIQHSASLSGGTSGSPMFTADGIVVAVNNSGIDYQVQVSGGNNAVRTPSAAEIGHAVRADLLAGFVASLGW